jgi:drug/metabolite transporter (DMT)-like permease
MWLTYAIAAAILWGLDYSFTEKIFKDKISPLTLLAAQMLVAPLIFLIVGIKPHLRKEISMIISTPSLLFITILIIVTITAANFLMYLAIHDKNATLAGLIELCYPVFTAIFTLVLFKENHLNLSIVIGAILIFTGAAIISFYS